MVFLIIAAVLVAAPVYLCILVVAVTLGKHATLFTLLRTMRRNNTEQPDNEES